MNQEACGLLRWARRWRTAGGGCRSGRPACASSTPGCTPRHSHSPCSGEPPPCTSTTRARAAPPQTRWTSTSTRSCRRQPTPTETRTSDGAGKLVFPRLQAAADPWRGSNGEKKSKTTSSCSNNWGGRHDVAGFVLIHPAKTPVVSFTLHYPSTS